MPKLNPWPLALASLLATATATATAATAALADAGHADFVVSYTPGTGFATEFGSGLGMTNAAAALGAPARTTPGAFGGPVDPFSPPYLPDQIVSVGAGGELTVFLNTSIAQRPDHRYGIDFTIQGNTGFVIANGDYTGGGITDGSRFGSSLDHARVSVSADGIEYYVLDTPGGVASSFPTDGAGDFSLAVNPVLTASDFNGKDLAGIRALYGGAGGGMGFDLAWARDARGQNPNLDSARFVKVEVLSGHVEVDAFTAVPAVVPEPSTLALGGIGLLGLWAARRGHRSGRL